MPLRQLKEYECAGFKRLYIYIYIEYYTVARRYEFMFEWREQPLEHKIYFFELTCNFLFIIWTINIHVRDGKADLNTNTGY